MATLKAGVDDIEAIPHLNSWWWKYSPEIALLMPADRDDLTAHCTARKTIILTALAQRQRGNGEDETALAVAQG